MKLPLGSEQTAFAALRISLALIFIWFGLLKVFGYNPVYEIVYSTYPLLASEWGNVILGALESILGFGLLFNVFPKVVHISLVIHLLGTFLTFLTAPSLMFDPYFPILSLSGEFVFKNATLVTAGWLIFVHSQRKSAR